MTYPTPPDEIVDFDSGRPVPDYDIGRQFQEHARAMTRIIEFIETTFRSDGRLKNDAIGPEQLTPDIAEKLAKQALFALDEILTRVQDYANEAVLARMDAVQARIKAEAVLARLVASEAAWGSKGQEVLQRLDAREKSELQAAQDLAARGAPPGEPARADAVPGGVYPNPRTVLDASVYGAEQWAEVSLQWAEHLPDTIPPNILAMNAITGEHWSSRWWAIRSAGAFGMLAWFYCGAWPDPPSQTLTGDPLTPGCLWFNTSTNTMMVWNGTTWQSFAVPSKTFTATLYYKATTNQTVFDLGTPDLFGNSYTLNPNDPEGIETFVNGVRLTPDPDPAMPIGDYYTTIPVSQVTLAQGVPQDTVVAIDILAQESTLTPSAVDIEVMTNINTPPGTQDGVQTVFALTVKADQSVPNLAGAEELVVSQDGVIQEPGVQYTAMGANITFAAPPAADSYVFILWFKSPVNNG